METPIIDYPGPVADFLFNIIKSNPGTASITWSVASVLFCALIYYFAVFKRSREQDKRTPWWEIGIVLLGVFLLRLPNLILPEQNVDESQWIANAATFYNGAKLWTGVTGYSGGPLLFVPLCVMNVLQVGLSYASIRLFGLLFCVLPSIWIVWLLFKKLFNASTALLLVAPLALFFAFAFTFDMIAYNSEHVPMLLIATSIYLLFTFRNDSVGINWKLVVLGFVLGVFPWAKLQAMPIAFTIGLMALYEIVFDSRVAVKRKINSGLQLAFGALLPSILFFIYLFANGALIAFYDDYILGNLDYAGLGMGDHRTGIARYWAFIPMFRNTHDARLLYVTLGLLLVFSIVCYFKSTSFNSLRSVKHVIYSFLIAGVSLFMVTSPGNANLFHYQLLFVIPATVFIGIVTGRVLQQNDFRLTPAFRLSLSIVFAIPLLWILKTGNRGVAFVKNGGNYKLSETSKIILRFAQPNDRMSVWGWAENYHVETGLIQGHAEPHPHYRIFADSVNNTRLDRYVEELKESNPVIFLDAVAPQAFYYRKPEYKHDRYPPLHDCVQQRYTFAGVDDGRRVYVRNDKIVKPLLNHPR